MAIAWAAQPGTTPPNACVFPVGLSSCFFGGPTSLGCGATEAFHSSSDESAVGANSAAWINMAGPGTPNANATKTAVEAAVNGNCNGTTLTTGNQVGANNGVMSTVINYLMDEFPTIYANSPSNITVLKQDGTTAYSGHGWEVHVPVINTGSTCPPGAINSDLPIVGWTRFVITQVFDSGGKCAVPNHYPGNPWDAHCKVEHNGTATSLPPGYSGMKGIFGYYDCGIIPSPPTLDPVPRAALGNRLRLVKVYR